MNRNDFIKNCILKLIARMGGKHDVLLFLRKFFIFLFMEYMLFLYFNLCLSVMLDSPSCSFTSLPLRTTCCFSALISV